MASAVLLLALPVAAMGQVTVLEGERRGSVDPGASLIALNGEGCAVRYSQGSLDRAHHVLRRLELLTDYFNRWSDVPVPTAVYVVDRESHLRGGFPGVYGVPVRTAPAVVVTAALGDDGTVELWRQLLSSNRLPMEFGTPMTGTAQQAASLAIADVLLQAEASRGFAQRARLLGAQPWIGEIAAHVAAGVVFLMHEPQRLDEIAATYRRVGQGRQLELRSFSPLLAAGSREQVEQWLWYQSQFHQAAQLVLSRDGKSSVKKLLKMSKRAGGRLEAADLFARYPQLQSWLEERFSPAG